MNDHPIQEVLVRLFGLLVPLPVAKHLQRMSVAGYRGQVIIDGRDITTGLPREISIHIGELDPPENGCTAGVVI